MTVDEAMAKAGLEAGMPKLGTADQPKIIWGCTAIAKAINRSERATFHMLETGQLPGAKKVGGRWCFILANFYAAMRGEDD